MKPRNIAVLALAFAGAFFAVGIPYWQIPYSQLNLPHAVWGFPLVLAGGVAVVARAVGGTGFWLTALATGSAVPGAVMARVVYDTAIDPTSHNLWPFEIVLASGPGVVAGVLGALVGGVLVRLRG